MAKCQKSKDVMIESKRTYKHPTQQQRKELIRLVTDERMSRNNASLKVGIPKSTGKKILKDYFTSLQTSIQVDQPSNDRMISQTLSVSQVQAPTSNNLCAHGFFYYPVNIISLEGQIIQTSASILYFV